MINAVVQAATQGGGLFEAVTGFVGNLSVWVQAGAGSVRSSVGESSSACCSAHISA